MKTFLSWVILISLMATMCGFTDSPWSNVFTFPDYTAIQFRWRTVPIDSSDPRNYLEYEFRNTASMDARFFYIVGTDSGEVVYGRLDLKGNSSRLLAWFFESSMITYVQLAEPDSSKSLLKSMGLE